MATITPFRYPGSKNKLLPVLMEHLDQILMDQNTFMDVFVGGGSVLLEVARKYPKVQLYANDKDHWMYCFWKVVASDDSNKLNELFKLMAQEPTLELFYKLRNEPTNDEIECAYRAIFFNRTTFSGIFYSGPIGGKEQKSKYPIGCRYNVEKLRQKILYCHHLLVGRTQVSGLDFEEYPDFINTEYPAYLDPPYYIKGNILYLEQMTPTKHERLASILQTRKKWVLSYDDCLEIRRLYSQNKIIDLSARYCINGKKDNWESKNEFIILPN
jgi:DNA adenine methylase